MQKNPPIFLAAFVCLLLSYGLTANIGPAVSVASNESETTGRGSISSLSSDSDLNAAGGPRSLDLARLPDLRVDSPDSAERGARSLSKYSRSNSLAFARLSAHRALCRGRFVTPDPEDFGRSAPSRRYLLFRSLLI